MFTWGAIQIREASFEVKEYVGKGNGAFCNGRLRAVEGGRDSEFPDRANAPAPRCRERARTTIAPRPIAASRCPTMSGRLMQTPHRQEDACPAFRRLSPLVQEP